MGVFLKSNKIYTGKKVPFEEDNLCYYFVRWSNSSGNSLTSMYTLEQGRLNQPKN